MNDKYMREALKCANKALKMNEVPVGTVIVKDNVIVGRGYNQRDKKKQLLKHAELIAIEQANKKLGDWRLNDCDMYTTNEPCLMCAGAIQQARIRTVYIGSLSTNNEIHKMSKKILSNNCLNHKANLVYGILQNECNMIMQKFLKNIRNK